MRLNCTSLTEGPVSQSAKLSRVTALVPHDPYHQPPSVPAQLPVGRTSLSLSRVVNILPLAIQVDHRGFINASPASPLYPATVSRYLPTSSLMENVEYSAEYHRPEVRWIYSQTHVTLSIFYQSSLNLLATTHQNPILHCNHDIVQD